MSRSEEEARVLNLYHLRQDIGKLWTPSEAEIVVVEEQLKQVQEKMLARLLTDTITKTKIEEREKELLEKEGRKPTRRQLCSDLVARHLVRPLENSSVEMLRKNDHKGFIATFDFSQGAGLAIDEIFKGEIGTRFESVDRAMTGRLIKPELEDYLKGHRQASHAAKLLKADKTGFLLLDDYLERLKQSEGGKDFFQPFLIPEFVVLGAEFSVEAYKTLYRSFNRPK